jgi:hypothetical protein
MWSVYLFVDLYGFQALRFFMCIARASWFIHSFFLWYKLTDGVFKYSHKMTKIRLHSFGLVPTSYVLLGGWSSPCVRLCGNVVRVSCPFLFVYTNRDTSVGTNMN